MIELESDWAKALGVRPSVSAVILQERRLLLQKRSDGGQWGLPGGSVEVGESVLQALSREVREETGLLIQPSRLIGVYSDPSLQVVRYPSGHVWQYVNLCFECGIQGGQLATSEETLELRFFSPRRLPATLLPNHQIRVRDALLRRRGPFIR